MDTAGDTHPLRQVVLEEKRQIFGVESAGAGSLAGEFESSSTTIVFVRWSPFMLLSRINPNDLVLVAALLQDAIHLAEKCPSMTPGDAL